jgi:hypothetical protein
MRIRRQIKGVDKFRLIALTTQWLICGKPVGALAYSSGSIFNYCVEWTFSTTQETASRLSYIP